MSLTRLADLIWNRHAPDYVSFLIPPERAADSGTSPLDGFAAGECYLEVRLARMHLRDRGAGWRDFLPLASVLTEFAAAGVERPDPVPFVIGPDTLAPLLQGGAAPVDIDYRPVAGPSPYLGGDVRLLAVLYRTVYQDWAKRTLGLVEKVAKQADISRVTSVLDVAPIVVSALEDLLGMQQVELRLGFDRTLDPSGDPAADSTLRPGWLVFFEPGPVPPREVFYVRRNRLYTLAPDNKLYEYVERDHLLLHVRSLAQRGDYTTLDFAAVQWPKVQELVWKHQYDAADAAFSGAFTASLMQCAELTRAQRIALFTTYETTYVEDRRRAQEVAGGAAHLDAPRSTREFGEDELAAAATTPVVRPDLEALADAYA